MDLAGKCAAVSGLFASIMVAAMKGKYPWITAMGEPLIVALCVSAALKSTRQLRERSKILGGDLLLLSRDPVYRELRADHRRFGSLSAAGLAGALALRFDFYPLLVIPTVLVCLVLSFPMFDRALGWKN